MKKGFRGGAGQGPKKGKEKEKTQGGFGGSSKSDKGKSRREIKNARGLRDVLGLGGGDSRSTRPTGAGGGRSTTWRDKDADRGSDEAARPKGPQSKKLTYIMTFQPPEETAREKEPTRPTSPTRITATMSPPASVHEEPVEKGPSGKEGRRGRSTERGAKERDRERGQERDRNQGQDRNRGRNQDRERGRSARVERKPAQDRGPSEERKPVQDRAPIEGRKPAQGRAPAQDRRPASQSDRAEHRWPQDRVAQPATPERGAGRSRSARGIGARRVEGIVKRHPDGFGFVIADDRETPDVYVPRHAMGGVMTNDRVEVELFEPRGGKKGHGKRGSDKSDKEERLSGEIIRIVKRSNQRVVGRYMAVDRKYGIIQDDGRGWGADLRIAAKDSMDAEDGEMVAVEVLQYPDEDREFTGRVVSILGDLDDPVNDVIRVVHASGIPNEFSKAAVAEARKFGGVVTDQELKGREDITELPICTIDGVTARDFDDAIYVEKSKRGFRLVVAIADVSHYVKPGTPLDQEAYERGTSTYFPNFVVPMLPEELSNELCSLKPNVTRLCFCCEMNIDHHGEIIDYRFFEGVMESKARVTYGEAQEVVDGKELANGPGRDPDRLEDVEENIRLAADLARILMAKRFREGSLDLEIPETQVVVDKTGETADIIRSERLFAHRLIEELMLVTNICTARFLDEAELPGIYRIHEEPDPENIKALQRYLWNLGGSRSLMGDNLAKKITQALESMSDKPEAQILNVLTLRTMQQARYSETNVGHFGLGFSHYSHFTSPIRRYPDLIAHRLIKSEISPRYKVMRMSEEELASATTWLSACEQRSVKAERKVISIKKARFMRQFEGQEFEGIISSVAKFGIFVMLRQYDVDGLVRMENLGADRFFFDEENLRLIGSRTGMRYVIGDAIKVRVATANPEDGRIEFILPSDEVMGREDAAGEDEEFEFDPDDIGDKEPLRGGFKAGKQKQGRKTKRLSDKKRGKAANDRRSVRKERVSKRRRKD